jgi:hypothetical protein
MRGMFTRIALTALTTVAVFAQVFAPAVAAGGPITGNIGTSSYFQVGRPTLSATTTCGDSVTTGTAGASSNRRYRQWAFPGPLGLGNDQCATISFTATKNISLAAYLDTFSPNAVSSALAGGTETTDSCMGTSGTFSFFVPAGMGFVIVASECKPGAGGSVTFAFEDLEPITYSADNRIRKGNGPLVGDDVYGQGMGELVTATKAPKDTAKFTISVENEGNVPETFVLYGYAPFVAGYKVTYFHGTTDITSAVTAATYVTASIAPGATFAITAKVKVQSAALPGSDFLGIVSAAPWHAALAQDTVAFIVNRK